MHGNCGVWSFWLSFSVSPSEGQDTISRHGKYSISHVFKISTGLIKGLLLLLTTAVLLNLFY